MTRRITTATIEGRTYEIPEMYFVGGSRRGLTPGQVVQWWHEQAQLEDRWNREQSQVEKAA